MFDKSHAVYPCAPGGEILKPGSILVPCPFASWKKMFNRTSFYDKMIEGLIPLVYFRNLKQHKDSIGFHFLWETEDAIYLIYYTLKYEDQPHITHFKLRHGSDLKQIPRNKFIKELEYQFKSHKILTYDHDRSLLPQMLNNRQSTLRRLAPNSDFLQEVFLQFLEEWSEGRFSESLYYRFALAIFPHIDRRKGLRTLHNLHIHDHVYQFNSNFIRPRIKKL